MEEKRDFSCNICQKKFEKSCNLRRHQLDVHKIEKKEKRVDSGGHFFILEDEIDIDIKRDSFGETKEKLGMQKDRF